jgi:hypothetical protein
LGILMRSAGTGPWTVHGNRIIETKRHVPGVVAEAQAHVWTGGCDDPGGVLFDAVGFSWWGKPNVEGCVGKGWHPQVAKLATIHAK